jgi:hypothetical protein
MALTARRRAPSDKCSDSAVAGGVDRLVPEKILLALATVLGLLTTALSL